MKHILPKLLTLLLCLTSAVPIYSQYFTYEGINYRVISSDDKTAGVAENFWFYGVADIPSTVLYDDESYTVTSIENYAFQYCSGLTSVIIPNSVTKIGDGAFVGCSEITSVTIPASVTSIGKYVFYECTALTDITVSSESSTYKSKDGVLFSYDLQQLLLCPAGKRGSYTVPSSVTTIGKSAFYGCSSLTAITIGNSVSTIEYYAFVECSNLTNINVASGNTNFKSLNGVLFSYDIQNLIAYPAGKKGHYTIPASVTTIGVYAFYGCDALSSVIIPESVETIEYGAFEGCSGLTSVTIPASVTSIGESVFNGCTALTDITVSSGNRIFTSKDGILFSKDMQSLLLCPVGKNGLYTVPATVSTIGRYAFYQCSGLTSVTIPSSVVNIEYAAFCECRGLTSFTIPSSVTKIEDYTFDSCSGLTSVTIPNSVTTVGKYAFSYCSGLTSVTIPESVTTIGSGAFNYCSGLTSVTIPESVTTIGSDTFFHCSSLTTVTIPNSVTEIGWNAFYGCTGLTSVVIPDKVSFVGMFAFMHCDNLKEVTLPAGLETLETYVFLYCRSIEKVVYRGAEPVEAPSNVFDDSVYDNATLYVRTGKTDQFKEVSPWKYFSLFSEYTLSGIEDIPVAEVGGIDRTEPYEVYNLNGIRVSDTVENLTPGIYVLRQGRKMQKIAVR